MKTFALITEGITDYLVIKELLLNYFKDDEPIINQIQPAKDETDKQTTGGGWNEVINYCSNENIKEINLYNDYIVIQIDTDIAEDNRINIKLHNKSNIEIYEAMRNKLIEFISSQINDIKSFIFAIGIHQIECWLVGIIDNKHTYKNVNNCIKRLNIAIGKSDKYKIIPPKSKENSKQTYTALAAKLKKKEQIIKYSKKNIGFEKFIDQLNSI